MSEQSEKDYNEEDIMHVSSRRMKQQGKKKENIHGEFTGLDFG
jgi:hypothetical protein